MLQVLADEVSWIEQQIETEYKSMLPQETGSLTTDTTCTSTSPSGLVTSAVPVTTLQQSDITTFAPFASTEVSRECGTNTITATETTTITETETTYHPTSDYGALDASLTSTTHAVHPAHSWPNSTTTTAIMVNTTFRNTGTSAPAFSTVTVAVWMTGASGFSSFTAGVPQGPSHDDGYNSTLTSSETDVESSFHAPMPESTATLPAGTAPRPAVTTSTADYEPYLSSSRSLVFSTIFTLPFDSSSLTTPQRSTEGHDQPKVSFGHATSPSTSQNCTTVEASTSATELTAFNASSTESWGGVTTTQPSRTGIAWGHPPSTWQGPTTNSFDEDYPSTGQHGAPYTATCVRCTDQSQTPVTEQSQNLTNTFASTTASATAIVPPKTYTHCNSSVDASTTPMQVASSGSVVTFARGQSSHVIEPVPTFKAAVAASSKQLTTSLRFIPEASP